MLHFSLPNVPRVAGAESKVAELLCGLLVVPGSTDYDIKVITFFVGLLLYPPVETIGFFPLL